MPWKKFNREMRNVIDEGAGILKAKLDAKTVDYDEVLALERNFLSKINEFYSKLDEQLVEGYDPRKYDFMSAIKDLTVGMLETFVHIGTGGASAVAQSMAKQVALNVAKRAVGFDAPTADFKNPTERTIQETTNIIGNNAIGRTIGRAIASLEEALNPNKAKEEFYRMRERLDESQAEISKYVAEKLSPLTKQGREISKEQFKTEIKSNFKRELKEKLDKFVQRLKDYPDFQKELVASLVERKQSPKFLPTLIKESYDFVNLPSSEKDDVMLGSTNIGQSGLRDKWRAVLIAIQQSQQLLSSPVVQQIGGTKKYANGRYQLIDMNTLLGFDTKERWFWDYRT